MESFFRFLAFSWESDNIDPFLIFFFHRRMFKVYASQQCDLRAKVPWQQIPLWLRGETGVIIKYGQYSWRALLWLEILKCNPLHVSLDQKVYLFGSTSFNEKGKHCSHHKTSFDHCSIIFHIFHAFFALKRAIFKTRNGELRNRRIEKL